MKLYLEFINAARGTCRSQRLSHGRGGAELHPCRGEARHLAVGAELYDPSARNAARRPSPHSNHEERGAHRGGRAAAPYPRPGAGGHRRGAGLVERVAGEARRHDPHHDRGASGRGDPLARLREAAARLPRHQGRAHHRLRPGRHRCRALRRRRPARRAGGEGHDRRAYRAGHAHGGRRGAFLLRKTAAAAEAAGPDSPRLHQHPPAYLRRTSTLGSSRKTGAS